MSTASASRKTWTYRGLLLAGAALLALTFGPAPVMAGDGHSGKHRKHGKQDRRYNDHDDAGYRHGNDHGCRRGDDHSYRRGHDYRHGDDYDYRHGDHPGYRRDHDQGHRRDHFDVPVVIHNSAANAYEDYYHGRAWFGPHRHHHRVYYFPVIVRNGYDYRPHFYCGDRLFEHDVAYAGPRFSLSVGF